VDANGDVLKQQVLGFSFVKETPSPEVLEELDK